MDNKRRVLLKYPIIYIYISKVNGRTNWLTRDGCNCRDVNFNRWLKKKKRSERKKNSYATRTLRDQFHDNRRSKKKTRPSIEEEKTKMKDIGKNR